MQSLGKASRRHSSTLPAAMLEEVSLAYGSRSDLLLNRQSALDNKADTIGNVSSHFGIIRLTYASDPQQIPVHDCQSDVSVNRVEYLHSCGRDVETKARDLAATLLMLLAHHHGRGATVNGCQ